MGRRIIFFLEIVLSIFSPEIRMYLAIDLFSLPHVSHFEEFCSDLLHKFQPLILLPYQQLKQIIFLFECHQINREFNLFLELLQYFRVKYAVGIREISDYLVLARRSNLEYLLHL